MTHRRRVFSTVTLVIGLVLGAAACSSGATSTAVDIAADSGTPASSGEASDASTGTADGSKRDGATADGGPLQLDSDPKNCGFAGHSCEASCVMALCTPVVARTWPHTSAPFFIQNDTIYYSAGTDVRAGAVADPSTDVTIATTSSTMNIGATKSKVYLWGSTGGLIVDKVTHTTASFSITKNYEPVGRIVGNDDALWFFDGNQGLLWTVPITGGPALADYDLDISSVAADESGLYYVGGPRHGSSGLTHVAHDNTTTVLSKGSYGRLLLGAAYVYGAQTTSSGAPPVELWAVPKAGGARKSLLTVATAIDHFVGDDRSLLWYPGGSNPKLARLEPAFPGGKPTVLVPALHDVQIAGSYAYWMDAFPTAGGWVIARVVR